MNTIRTVLSLIAVLTICIGYTILSNNLPEPPVYVPSFDIMCRCNYTYTLCVNDSADESCSVVSEPTYNLTLPAGVYDITATKSMGTDVDIEFYSIELTENMEMVFFAD